MLKRTNMIIVIAVLMCIGCASLQTIHEDPRAEYVAANEAFAAVVRSLADLRLAGAFDKDEVEAIDVLIEKGREVLEVWYQDVSRGTPVEEGMWNKMQNVISQLRGYSR